MGWVDIIDDPSPFDKEMVAHGAGGMDRSLGLGFNKAGGSNRRGSGCGRLKVKGDRVDAPR
jgi:hypothetical protein